MSLDCLNEVKVKLNEFLIPRHKLISSLALIEHSISISAPIATLGLLNAVTSALLSSDSLCIIWRQSDEPGRPLTVQTVLSLPNGQMHLVIFTSNSYNDEKAEGVGLGGGGGAFS